MNVKQVNYLFIGKGLIDGKFSRRRSGCRREDGRRRLRTSLASPWKEGGGRGGGGRTRRRSSVKNGGAEAESVEDGGEGDIH